jgi:hypothetical protein
MLKYVVNIIIGHGGFLVSDVLEFGSERTACRHVYFKVMAFGISN